MRLLNPKHALATVIIVFMIWLAMSGKLVTMLNFTKPGDK